MYHCLLLCTAAVKRKYEGLRKRWKDEEKENCEEVQQFVNKRKQYRARRLRVWVACVYVL